MASSTSVCRLLSAIIALQWILFTILLLQRQRHGNSSSSTCATTTGDDDVDHPTSTAMRIIMAAAAAGNSGVVGGQQRQRHRQQQSDHAESSEPPDEVLQGVMATIIFRAPKWFHLRYLVMLHNALVNLPSDKNWKLQVFLNMDFASTQLWSWHPGLYRFFYNHSSVILTPLPTNLTQRGSKPKHILQSLWFWNSLQAEHVVLFSGNGAFCSNQPIENAWKRLMHLDYCGVPSGTSKGGDGSSHSIRRRNSMLRVWQYTYDNKLQIQSPEYKHVVHVMQDIMKQKHNNTIFHIANRQETELFGGVTDLSDDSGLQRLPLVVAGTQNKLSYEDRDTLLKHCPELKVIFPSLHEPSCFGAHPNGEKCKSTICALQGDNIPSHGC